MTAPDATDMTITRDGADAVVAAALAAALGFADIDSHTGFFDLGADSATIVRFAARLREHWPDLRTVDIFSHPTVSELAAFLAAGAPSGGRAEERRSGDNVSESVADRSPGQQSRRAQAQREEGVGRYGGDEPHT